MHHRGGRPSGRSRRRPEVLTSPSFNVGTSRTTGGIYPLSNPTDTAYLTNYVLNRQLRPVFDINDSRWLRDIVLTTNGVARVTSLSDDIRTVTRTGDEVKVVYFGIAAHANGIRGFGLTLSYKLSGTAALQRPNAVGPYLVMVPEDGTALEFRDKARTAEGPFGEVDPSWEGLVQFNIHSKTLQTARADKMGGHLPATSLTLARPFT